MSIRAAACPSPETLLAFGDGVLASGPRQHTIAHLAECAACSAAVAAALDSAAHDLSVGADTPQGGPTPGAQLGRYRLVEFLGAGAMGTVYSAADPSLDRQVAIKVVHTDRATSSGAQQRLLNEARAMAQLNHPNVVDVYDAGQCRWGVYIVMECIIGEGLEQWAAGRPWTEVVGAFIEAGRGLAAAHDRGLIHRDFKPPNVLVGRDGRARVTDFGLVLSHPASVEASSDSDSFDAVPQDASETSQDSVGSTADVGASRLTAAGGTVGTPAYLAPEQFQGAPATPRSDQFSFCIALAKLVYGSRPNTGTNVLDLVTSSRTAAENLDTTKVDAPRKLAEIVRRGLSCDPDERFASMHALVAALERIVAGRRSRRPLLAAVVAGVALVAGLAAASQPDRSTPSCAHVTNQVDDVWSWSTRVRLEEHLRRTSSDAARRAAVSIPARLEDYAVQWVGARTELCHETAQRPEVGVSDAEHDADLDAAIECLDRRLLDLRAATTIILDAQTTNVQATSVAAALPSPQACLNRKAGDAFSPSLATPAEADERRRLWGRIAEVSAWMHVYRFGRALRILESEQPAIERLGDVGIDHRSRLQRGIMLGLQLEHDDAHEVLESLYADAVEGGHAAMASLAAIAIADDLARDSRDAEAAERWARAGLSHAERTGSLKHRLEALRVRGALELHRGNIDVAFELATHGLELAAASSEGPPLEVEASLHHVLGNVALVRGSSAAAQEAFGSELELLQRRFGSDHPRITDPLLGLVQIALRHEDPDRAERLLERREAALGTAADADATQRTFSLAMRSVIAEQRGDHGSSVEYAQAAIESTSDVKGPDHPDLVPAIGRLGRAALIGGDPRAALDAFVAAAELCRRLSNRSHACGGERQLLIGHAHLALGEPDAALETLRVGLADLERRHGSGSMEMAFPLVLAGEALLLLDQKSEALEVLRRAQVIVAGQPSDADTRAHIEFALARGLLETDPSATARYEARLLADAALAAYRAMPRFQADADAIERWIAKHSPN